MQINPVDQYEYHNAGDLIVFNIKISSTSEVSEYRIIETQHDGAIDTLEFKYVQGTDIDELFLYTVPSISEHDTSEVKLFFYCKDINGKSHEVVRLLYAVSLEVLLTETPGGFMYSSSSTGFNAFDLLECKSTFSTDSTSTSHIQDELDTISDILSRKWISTSNLDFTKANGLDYANATSYILQNVYESNLIKPFVDDIQPGDIIITKIDNIYIAIKLTSVIDEPGVDNDVYYFNIKK